MIQPDIDSAGRRIHAEDLGVANFWRWFGGSKVVDEEGRPLVVFHGTAHPSWEEGRTEFGRTNGMGEGAYFSPDAHQAGIYASMDNEVEGDPPFLVPVYLALKNPKFLHDTLDMQEITIEQRKEWEAQGHDGMMGFWGGNLCEIAVWNPEKIKSAIGNDGRFDPQDPSIVGIDGPGRAKHAIASIRVRALTATISARQLEGCSP